MKIYNDEIAKLFNRLADLLEIENANPFRIRAYRNAAQTISNYPRNIADLVEEKSDLTELPYIGGDLAEKIKIIVKTGKFPALLDVEKRIPSVLSQLMDIEGLGPKRVQVLYKKLNIQSIAELKNAIASGKLCTLKGFGKKLEQKIKEGMEHVKEYQLRYKLIDAMAIAEPLVGYLKKITGVKYVEVSGSYRRRRETVGDLDIIVIAKKNAEVIKRFVKYDEVSEIISQGTTRSTIRLRRGIQVDLRVMPAVSYGSALLYFTGSKSHNIALRTMALKQKLKINEYGLFRNNKRIAGKNEAEIYKAIGLPYIEPELRENRGEIEIALKNKLPKLITLADICGDLHCHTNATDGTANLETMVKAAVKKGYEYIAITDHSKHLTVAKGLDEKKLLTQIKAIDKLNAKLNNIVILKSIELDILEDGTLDLSNNILKELDLRVCSIHSQFHLSQKKQTDRIIRAMDNPYFNILAHPTGRLIGKREPYNINMEKVMLAAKERNCFLEVNSQPERLDLNDIYCKMAKEMGLKLVISTDAHSVTNFDYMQFGIYQARRGWLEASDIVNSRSLSELRRLLVR